MDARCPDAIALTHFLLGQGDESQHQAVEAHLAGCRQCLVYMQEMETSDPFVETIKIGRRPAPAMAAISADLVARLCRLAQVPETSGQLSSVTADTPISEKTPCFDFLDPPEEPRELGRIAGYAILEVLGSGGMGVVFRAFDPRLGRTVALKVILEARLRQPHYLARFRAEAAALGRLQHPNIVQIHEVGEHRGRPYFVLEYVPGGNLAQHLAQEPLPIRAAAELVATLADAVHYAHLQGIVHRDLKPANVLLCGAGQGARDERRGAKDEATASGGHSAPFISDTSSLAPHPSPLASPKITDFDLAKRLDNAGLTETGDLLGTPGYMAPELTAGRSKDSGPLVDVYSLGAILYELLTGRAPFRGETVLDTLEQVRTLEPVPPRRLQPKLPRDLQTICLTCLAREPHRRYTSAVALADDLGRFLADKPIMARPVSSIERVRKWIRRKPALSFLLFLCGLLAGALLVGGLIYQARLRVAVEQAEREKLAVVRQQQLLERNYQAARLALNSTLSWKGDLKGNDLTALREIAEHNLWFYDEIHGADDADPLVRRDTALACATAGKFQLRAGQNGPAAGNIRRAIALFQGLPKDILSRPVWPGGPRYGATDALARCYSILGQIAHAASKPEEREHTCRQALALRELILKENPSFPGAERDLANAVFQLGASDQERSRLAEAETHYIRALAIHTRVVAAEPTDKILPHEQADICVALGFLYKQRRLPDKAGDVFARADKLLSTLVALHPNETAFMLALANVRNVRADLLYETGQAEAARKMASRTVDLLEPVVHRAPGADPGHLHNAHWKRALACETLGLWADAARDWERMTQLNKDNTFTWRMWPRALARAGEHSRAFAELRKLEKKPDLKAEDCWPLITDCAQSARATWFNTQLSEAQRTDLTEGYASQAMRLLQKLQRRGDFQDPGNLRRLRTEPELFPLRGRPDFQKLLEEVSRSQGVK